MAACSLVPRLSKREGLGEREPGFNRLRMRQLAVEFQGDRIQRIVAIMQNQNQWNDWACAVVMNFDRSKFK